MHRIAGDDMASHVELFQQLLDRRDFVGFVVDFDMRQHQRRIDSERAEYLFCLGVVEAIKAAFERLAVKRDNSRTGNCCIEIQVGCVFAKDLFNIRRRQPLQNIPDGGMSGRPFPIDLEGLVELSPMDLDEGARCRGTSWLRSQSPKWKTAGHTAVDRVFLRRAVDHGLLREERGNVRMISRQPPTESVATHRFRTFRPEESLVPPSYLRSLDPVT
jgi:hypothetical protein